MLALAHSILLVDFVLELAETSIANFETFIDLVRSGLDSLL